MLDVKVKDEVKGSNKYKVDGRDNSPPESQ